MLDIRAFSKGSNNRQHRSPRSEWEEVIERAERHRGPYCARGDRGCGWRRGYPGQRRGSALGKIAGIMASDQQGRLLSLQERIDDAVKIARATIGEIESRMLAQNVRVKVAEIAQPRQPSTHGHGIGWGSGEGGEE